MTKSEWHFPREEFSKEIYKLLIDSPTSAISMFGPRRTGKTEFLLKDLAPFATAKKHRVVYVSMWQSVEEPIANLLYAFDRELRGGKLTDQIASTALDLAPKFTIKDPVTGSEIEIDTANLKDKTKIDPALLLDHYCDKLADDKRPTLLLFDEFQEIARHDNTDNIVASLRTSLDKRKTGLVSIFTGSSQDGLRKVFNAKKAPFYQFATQMTLPILGDAFVDHQLEIFQSKAKRSINRGDALSVFEKVEHNPMFFQSWLIAMMAHSTLTPDTAIDHVLTEIGERFGYDKVWKDLHPLQRAVLQLIAIDTAHLYGGESIKLLESLTPDSKPSNVNVQSAIRRFSRFEIIENEDNVWRINDPLLKVWVRGRPKSEFK
jgi:hypothetical protein